MIIQPLRAWPIPQEGVPRPERRGYPVWVGSRVDPGVVVEMVRAGGTGTSVGAALGVSRERVRQIWTRATGAALPTKARYEKRRNQPATCRVCRALVPRGRGTEHRRTAVKAHAVVRFWAKVDRGPAAVCWPWLGGIYKLTGYGHFNARHSGYDESGYAHRFAYEVGKGPIPVGLTIDHLCRNRACVNPVHLEAVPIGVNVLRGNGMGARNARKTHCKRNHPFSAENTRLEPQPNGRIHRICLACPRSERQQPCRRGHAFNSENFSPSGNCRPCAQLAYRARKAAA